MLEQPQFALNLPRRIVSGEHSVQNIQQQLQLRIYRILLVDPMSSVGMTANQVMFVLHVDGIRKVYILSIACCFLMRHPINLIVPFPLNPDLCTQERFV